MNFWDRKSGLSGTTQNTLPQQEIVLDEEVMAELQEDPNTDIFEEEEEDTSLIMSDANLRLEQGRLYQMVLQNDIFADTNADPKAIRNVQREIRKFVRERMETMLGIRQELSVQQTIISSPFSDLEVTALKMVASKVTKGATETETQPIQSVPTIPKKDGITSISGNLRPNTPPTSSPVRTPKPLDKPIPAKPKQQAKSAINKEAESALQKPIEEMTPAELEAHNKAAEERSKKKYAAMPNNLTPHPSPQQLETLYTIQANDRLAQHAQKMAVK